MHGHGYNDYVDYLNKKHDHNEKINVINIYRYVILFFIFCFFLEMYNFLNIFYLLMWLSVFLYWYVCIL